MKKLFLGFCAMLALNIGYSQCVADFDFGDLPMGVSPNPMTEESLEDGLVGSDYYDVLHILLPYYANDVDSTLELPANTLLDSLSLVSITMVNVDDANETYTPEEMGLEVICNNNGDSGNPCSFLGNSQYCASIEGVPTVDGQFFCQVVVEGWITVFGFPVGQEVAFGQLTLTVNLEGCTDPAACNYNADATIDDGSCEYECLGCTDEAATNYDETANIDDGSCCYLVVDAVTTDVNCYGGIGMVDFSVMSTESVEFVIDGGTASSELAYDFEAGTYSVLAYELGGNMCEYEFNFTISQPDELTITATASDESVLGLGQGTATVEGGSPDYTISWTEAAGGNPADPDNLPQGDYIVSVIDSNGCEASTTVTVLWDAIESINEVAFNLFPNPTDGNLTLRAGKLIRNARIEIFDATGRSVQAIENIMINGDLSLDLSELNAGAYSLAISTDQGRTLKHLQIVK